MAINCRNNRKLTNTGHPTARFIRGRMPIRVPVAQRDI